MAKVLICDLDNTLYDWVEYFVEAFYEMVDDIVAKTGINREIILDDFKRVHQNHADSEHPFALVETRFAQDIFPGLSRRQLIKQFDSAFHRFNAARKRSLHCYAGVHETLTAVQRAGVRIVAHTESKVHAVVDRLLRLSLDSYFERVFCREWAPVDGDDFHSEYAAKKFKIAKKIVELSHHQRKPDASVLLEICAVIGVVPSEVVYVGDSITRDVMMAKSAGAYSVWAAYGASHRREVYDKLVRITHWTDEDVRRERQFSEAARHIKPDFVARTSFSEVLQPLGLMVRSTFAGAIQ